MHSSVCILCILCVPPSLFPCLAVPQEHSAATITTKVNVCSVQFSPDVAHLIAAGSANSKAYLYDLRHTAAPLATICGHTKAVSYVRFLGAAGLVRGRAKAGSRHQHSAKRVRLWVFAGGRKVAGDDPGSRGVLWAHVPACCGLR